MIAAGIEDLLRGLAPQVLGAVVRRYGNFDLAEGCQPPNRTWSRSWRGFGIPVPLGR